jgi:hypothetical protein
MRALLEEDANNLSAPEVRDRVLGMIDEHEGLQFRLHSLRDELHDQKQHSQALKKSLANLEGYCEALQAGN